MFLSELNQLMLEFFLSDSANCGVFAIYCYFRIVSDANNMLK